MLSFQPNQSDRDLKEELEITTEQMVSLAHQIHRNPFPCYYLRNLAKEGRIGQWYHLDQGQAAAVHPCIVL